MPMTKYMGDSDAHFERIVANERALNHNARVRELEQIYSGAERELNETRAKRDEIQGRIDAHRVLVRSGAQPHLTLVEVRNLEIEVAKLSADAERQVAALERLPKPVSAAPQ